MKYIIPWLLCILWAAFLIVGIGLEFGWQLIVAAAVGGFAVGALVDMVPP